jgi:hypothetical protein
MCALFGKPEKGRKSFRNSPKDTIGIVDSWELESCMVAMETTKVKEGKRPNQQRRMEEGEEERGKGSPKKRTE